MKEFMKERSYWLLVIAILESILGIVATISFVYSDALTYADSQVIVSLGVEKLLENLYSSTWWALILLLLSLIAILTITALVYKNLMTHFISMLCWGEMLILAINLNKSLLDNIAALAIFIPIIIINIVAYRDQKELNEKKDKKKK